MRDYLFRGKREDNGEWVEGYLSYCSTRKQYYIMDSVQAFPIPVRAETVGQYTTQDDINDKKIFDGDIVNFQRVNALGYTTCRTGEVRWYDELPIFYILATTGDGWDWVDCENIEVIGNIYDDDLLEEDE